LLRAAKQFIHLRVRKRDRQYAVLEAVVVEDIRIAGRDDDAEPVVEQRPGGVLAARAAAKVGAREQNRRATVARLVQHKIGVWLLGIKIPPVIEQELAVALPRQQLQKLLGHHLIGVDVDAIERGYKTGVFRERLHPGNP